MNVTLSRGTGINTEKCVENAGGNRYNLVLIACHRARDIERHNIQLQKQAYENPIVSALLDVQNGAVGEEYLKRIRTPNRRV